MKPNLGSIIVPCYNEELRFDLNYFKSLNKKLLKYGVELVFVNDGSTDGTLDILKQVSFKPRILNLKKNVGKAEAIRKAMIQEIKINNKILFGYLDSDAAFDSNDISTFVNNFISNKKLQNYKILSAARVKLAGISIKRKTYRHVIGRLISTILNLGFENKVYDPQSGFKLFRRSNELIEAFAQPFATRWFIDMEIMNHYKYHENSIIEMPVSSWVDTPGSKIVIKEYFRIFFELTKIKLMILKRTP
jgi:glycosyltransferase involved in cell wall biosynthesis